MKIIKQSIVLPLSILFLFGSCTYEGHSSDLPLTRNAQSMYNVWLLSSKDCIATYLQVAQQIDRYENGNDSVKNEVNHVFFPNMTISKDISTNLVSVYRSGETYFEVDVNSSVWRVVSSMSSAYYQSFIDVSQQSNVTAAIIQLSSPNWDLAVDAGTKIAAHYEISSGGAIVSGEGFFTVNNVPYDSDPVFGHRNNNYNDYLMSVPARLEYKITSPLVDNNGEFTAGRLDLQAINLNGDIETAIVEFFSEYTLFTYRGVSEKVYRF